MGLQIPSDSKWKMQRESEEFKLLTKCVNVVCRAMHVIRSVQDKEQIKKLRKRSCKEPYIPIIPLRHVPSISSPGLFFPRSFGSWEQLYRKSRYLICSTIHDGSSQHINPSVDFLHLQECSFDSVYSHIRILWICTNGTRHLWGPALGFNLLDNIC